MGLFAGVVFLLVNVFSTFMLDTFPLRSNQALAIAEGEIAMAVESPVLVSSTRDTLGFRVTRGLEFQRSLVEIEVTVTSQGQPYVLYAELTSSRPL